MSTVVKGTEVKISAEELKNVISELKKMCSKARLSESILFVTANEEKLCLYVSGKDFSAQKEIPIESGNISFSTSLLEMFVKTDVLPRDEVISLMLEEQNLYLAWGRSSKIAVATLPAETPVIDIPESIENIQWAPGQLHALTRNIPSFCAKPTSEKAKLNSSILGLNFSLGEGTGGVSVRASDGYKACKLKQDIQWFNGVELSIDAATLAGLAEVLPSKSEIHIGINESHTLLIFKAENTTAVIRVLDGQFPNLDKAYSLFNNAIAKWTFDRMELMDTCRRVSILSPNEPALTIKSKGSKTFAVLDHVLEQQIGALTDGDVFDFRVNAAYLELSCSLFRTEEVTILFQHKKGGLTVCSEENDQVQTLLGQMTLEN